MVKLGKSLSNTNVCYLIYQSGCFPLAAHSSPASGTCLLTTFGTPNYFDVVFLKEIARCASPRLGFLLVNQAVGCVCG